MTRRLFSTLVYDADVGTAGLRDALAHSIRSLAQDDRAGMRWSKDRCYPGYTSYASLDDLPKRDPDIGNLARLLAPHAVQFAQECAFELGRKPKLDSLWVNLLKKGGQHSGHIHPHSIISGTYYVEVPSKSGAIRFEDPRLGLMMAAPTRRGDAPDDLRPFVTIEPRPGLLLLWESWLRHEVLAGSAAGERLSVSFNFA